MDRFLEIKEAVHSRVTRLLRHMGLGPSRPAKRSPQSVTDRTVDTTSATVARLAQGERQPDPWENSRYQPLLNMRMVITRNGQLSARNAGAAASPDPVAPRSPSRPGTTHHQGRGSRPLSIATKGFSIRSSFNIEFLLDLLDLLGRIDNAVRLQ